MRNWKRRWRHAVERNDLSLAYRYMVEPTEERAREEYLFIRRMFEQKGIPKEKWPRLVEGGFVNGEFVVEKVLAPTEEEIKYE